MVNEENYYREYKGHTKWLRSHFAKNSFFDMTLHAHAHYMRGDKKIHRKVPPFFYSLINSDKILIYNRATHMQLISHNNADVSCPRALQP